MTFLSDFQLPEATKIIFEEGGVSRLSEFVPWESILLVTTEGATRRGTTEAVKSVLSGKDLEVFDGITPEPQLDALERMGNQYRGRNFDGIVAVGGGSTIDTAKILSYLLGSSTQNLRRHFENGEELEGGPFTPIVAIPTTAGTGSEVTSFATVWDGSNYKKYSLSLRDLAPKVAILDSQLTWDVPRSLTLSTGLDALCQGIESAWSRAATDASMMWALRAVSLTLESLPKVVSEGSDGQMRAKMLQASLLAGLAINVTKTTLPHSISYPLTMRFGVPHGLACAFTVVQVLEFNAADGSERILNIGHELGFSSVEDLANELRMLMKRTGALDWLATLIPSEDQLVPITEETITPGRADNNPRTPSFGDVEAILRGARKELPGVIDSISR